MKLCDACILLEEQLLWRMIQFVNDIESSVLQPAPFSTRIEPESAADSLEAPIRRCYFGNLELEMGTIALSVVTVPPNVLPPELRRLRKQFDITLVSFENAFISLPAFRRHNYHETLKLLLEALSKFYLCKLLVQASDFNLNFS